MPIYSITVPQENAGGRLDLFLMEYCQSSRLGVSRTTVQKLIGLGMVILNGVAVKKPHLKVKAADEITITVEDKAHDTPAAEQIPLDIVYEDEGLLVVNKQSGMVVHPAPGNNTHTLVNALLSHCRHLSNINPSRPGIVHRLDKGTSGVLLVAKNNFVHLELTKQFAAHRIKKVYLAIVKGRMDFEEHIIELPIGRHPDKRQSMSVGFGTHTRYAKTYYRTLQRNDTFSVLSLEPFTGRTHQLRVHLAFLGHPILGDTKYGKNNSFCRLALHAKTIGFIHPSTNSYMEFSCDVPQEFSDFIHKNRTQK